MSFRISRLAWSIIAFWYFSRGLGLIFLSTQSLVLWGIAITSALLFLGSSGELILISAQPIWAVGIIGAIAGIGVLLIAGCFVIAPGIGLSVAAGILYLGAGILVAATTQSSQATNSNSHQHNSMFWCVLARIGLIGAAVLFCFSSIGASALLFLPIIPFLILGIMLDLSRVLRAAPLSSQATLVLASMILFGLSVVFAGTTLSSGAISWSVEIVQSNFATIAVALVSIYLNKVTLVHQGAVASSQRRGITFLVGVVLVSGLIGIQGYGNFLKAEMTLNGRLSSLASPIFLQKILYTKLWNTTIVISPDTQFLAVGGSSLEPNQEKTIQLWSLKTGELIQHFSGEHPVFSDNRSSGPVLVTSLNNNLSITVWNLRSREFQRATLQDEILVQSQQQRRGQVISLPSFVPEGGIFLAASADNKVWVTGFSSKDLSNQILVWNRQVGKLICSLSIDNAARPTVAARYATALSSDGQVMATIPQQGDESGRIYIWRLPELSNNFTSE